jgi:thiamine transport system substrate-binding protein
MLRSRIHRTALVTAAVAGMLVAGCASGSSGQSASTTEPAASGSSSGSSAGAASGEVTLITHDSFVVDEQLLKDFETESGLTVTVLAQGDAGAMVNQLLLTSSNPLGDAVFGIDNTFASKALEADVFQSYASPALPTGAEQEFGIGDDRLTPIDFGDVCVNVDHGYFAAKNLAEPVTFEDLAKPEYRDLLVVQSPATSSPGLAFLLGTIAHFGEDGWLGYWSSLKDNGVKVTAGWTDAYSVDFSGSSGKGPRPLVVSYASSPPAEIAEGATEAPTAALLDTCFRQVEYAGVLTGAKNVSGAERVIDFLLSRPFQESVAENMYVYPVDPGVALPVSWDRFAPTAASPASLDPATIAKNREKWITAWSDLMES